MTPTKRTHGSIKVTPKATGISLEATIRQAIATKQPIKGDAPMIYTPAKLGVIAEYDPRTDKQDLALQAMDKWQASDAMKGFIGQTEFDEEGTDGNGKTRNDYEPKEETTKIEE